MSTLSADPHFDAQAMRALLLQPVFDELDGTLAAR